MRFLVQQYYDVLADGSQKLLVLSAADTDLCLSFSYWGRFIASSLGRMWMNTLQVEVGQQLRDRVRIFLLLFEREWSWHTSFSRQNLRQL